MNVIYVLDKIRLGFCFIKYIYLLYPVFYQIPFKLGGVRIFSDRKPTFRYKPKYNRGRIAENDL